MPRTILLLLALFAFVVTMAANASPEPKSDHWSVRATGHPGAPRAVASDSDVNTGKPDADASMQALSFAQRKRGDVEVRVLADPDSLASLRAPGVDASIELDRALDWLQRLAGKTPARIELTAVDASTHRRVHRVHDDSDATVVDLVVPLMQGGTARSTPSSRLGQALAIALHEASHALHDGLARTSEQREADEKRASLVEACYLVDTLRVGDTLGLSFTGGANETGDFTARHSRDAARDAMRELARAAGGDVVAWNDPVAKLGVRTLCAVRLSEP
jgi:hypothetical protein